MTTSNTRFRLQAFLPTVLALSLALGWAWREAAHARERTATLASQTLSLNGLAMNTFKDGEQAVGQIGYYLQGETAGCSRLVTGRFIIDPGKSPHAPHTHEDEEILIVETGHGDIICDGKTTKVGPGSVMYSAPNVAHGINNTGAEPLSFYFVKWKSKGAAGSQ